MPDNITTAREVYDITFDTHERWSLQYQDDNSADLVKHDVSRMKDLFRALLETLTPEQLNQVKEYLNEL